MPAAVRLIPSSGTVKRGQMEKVWSTGMEKDYNEVIIQESRSLLKSEKPKAEAS